MIDGVILLLGTLAALVFIIKIVAKTDIDEKGYEFKMQEKETQINVLNQQIGELKEKNSELIHLMDKSQHEAELLEEAIEEERSKYKKILTQKKSSETRLGLISEQLTPFLKDCPYTPGDMIFLGKPIDFLVTDFDKGEIVFLEVKSGNARESARQKTIKNLIKKGHVYYEKLRINEKGVKITREQNE